MRQSKNLISSRFQKTFSSGFQKSFIQLWIPEQNFFSSRFQKTFFSVPDSRTLKGWSTGPFSSWLWAAYVSSSRTSTSQNNQQEFTSKCQQINERTMKLVKDLIHKQTGMEYGWTWPHGCRYSFIAHCYTILPIVSHEKDLKSDGFVCSLLKNSTNLSHEKPQIRCCGSTWQGTGASSQLSTSCSTQMSQFSCHSCWWVISFFRSYSFANLPHVLHKCPDSPFSSVGGSHIFHLLYSHVCCFHFFQALLEDVSHSLLSRRRSWLPRRWSPGALAASSTCSTSSSCSSSPSSSSTSSPTTSESSVPPWSPSPTAFSSSSCGAMYRLIDNYCFKDLDMLCTRWTIGVGAVPQFLVLEKREQGS